MDGYTYGLLSNVNRNTRDADREMMRAQGIIDDVARERNEAWAAIGRLRRELAVSRTHGAAVLAQAKALKGLLVQLAPEHPILAPTGRTFVRSESKKGQKETRLDTIYSEEFDRRAKVYGLANPEAVRALAR